MSEKKELSGAGAAPAGLAAPAAGERAAELEAELAGPRRAHGLDRAGADGAVDYAIITTDLERRVTSWSPGAAAVFGWSEAEVLGRKADLIFTPEDREAGCPEQEAAAAHRNSWAADERWHVRKDGGRFFAFGELTLLKAGDRRIGYLKIVRARTAQRGADRRLLESEARFRNLADHAPVMMWVTDPSGWCTYLNRRWYDFTGQTAEEAQGYGWLDATHPDDKPEAERVFRQSNSARAPFRVEYRLRRADGVYRWAIDSAEPRFGETGEYLGYVGSVIDIDDRREAEERLRESEARYRSLFTSIDVGFCVADVIFDDDRPIDYRFTEVNPAFERHTGLASAEGRTARELVPNLEPFWFEAYGRVALTGEPARFEHGSAAMARWFDVYAFPAGRPEQRRVAILFNDVSDRRSAEERVRRSEQRLRTMTDSLPAMVWTARQDGELNYFNDRWYEYTGQTPAQALPNGWADTLHPDDMEPTASAWADARAREVPYEIEVRYRRRDGAYRWHLARALPVRDAAGAVTDWIGTSTDTHDRKLAEERLRISEARFRAAVDAIEGVLWTNDAEGRMTGEQPGWSALTGQTQEEYRGYGWTAAVHPDDAQPTVDAWNVAVAERRPFDFQHRVRRRDGVWRTFSIKAVPTFDGDGAIREWVGVHTDVTDEREARAAAEAMAAEQAAILGQLAEGVVVTDASGRITFVNQAAERIHGGSRLYVDPADYGRSYRLLTEAGEPYPSESLPLSRAVRGETVQDARWRILRPDGSEVLAVGNARPVVDGGVRTGAVLTLRDETARLTVEAALRESEARFRNMADSAPALIWATDDEARVTFANRRYEQDFGLPPERILQDGWRELVLPEDVDSFFADFLRAFESRADFQREVRVRNKAGRIRWLRCEGTPRFDGGGRFLGYVGCNVDITEARLAQDALEDEVEARTLELQAAEESLRQAQKMEAVGQLTGGLAHDFNNLLTGVIGSLDLMQRRIAQGRTADVARYADAAMTSANRAAALTHRLLAFSRRQPLDPKPVDANRLIGGMEELLRRTLGEGTRLEIVRAGGLWLTLCDPNQLESAVLNLAINARDAMPDGGRLTIETSNAWLDQAYAARDREVRPGQYVCVSVTDTGVGMTSEVAGKAFDPFFTTKPIGQGTGLGLSMIYGFARQSEGHAKIYSEPGRGTTVKLYLPRFRGGVEAADEPAASLPPTTAIPDQDETVLVVEDEAAVRALVTEVLGDLGYRTLEAEDGPSGLRLLQSGARIDLLVTDIGLPGLNGRQLADAARVGRPDLPVLFMTGYAENAAIAAGFLEPGMQMITKPFAVEALTTRLRDMATRS